MLQAICCRQHCRGGCLLWISSVISCRQQLVMFHAFGYLRTVFSCILASMWQCREHFQVGSGLSVLPYAFCLLVRSSTLWYVSVCSVTLQDTRILRVITGRCLDARTAGGCAESCQDMYLSFLLSLRSSGCCAAYAGWGCHTCVAAAVVAAGVAEYAQCWQPRLQPCRRLQTNFRPGCWLF